MLRAMQQTLVLLVAMAFVASVETTVIAAVEKTVGSWLINTDKDPFSTKKKTVAITPASNREGALAIRCFPDGGLSVVVRLIGDKHYDAGIKAHFKYRADEGEIAEDSGEAFSEGLIEMPNAGQILRDAQTAGALFIRISTPDAAVVDLEFKMRGSVKALAQINQDCPMADEKTSPQSKVPGTR